jgi:phosphoribosyl-ATP pyrophosphohydrolase
MKADEIIASLDEILQARKAAEPNSSYVASLYDKGLDSILKKIAEESAETIMAAKDLAANNGDSQHVVYEVADLWFHTMVLLAQQDISSQEVLNELARRFGVSGIEEKASRAK